MQQASMRSGRPRPHSRCLRGARAPQTGHGQPGVGADLVLGEADVAPALGRVELGLLPETGRGRVARLARHEQGTGARTTVGELEHHDEARPARDRIALAGEQATAGHGLSRRRPGLERRRVRTEVDEVRDALPEALTAVNGHLAPTAVGALDLPQRDVDGQPRALPHADSLGERLENLVAPVTWGRQPARRVDGPLRIEVLGEEGPGPELVSRLEPGDELAPEHRTPAVEVKAPVPRPHRAAGQAAADGAGVTDDRGSPGPTLA